MTNEQRLNKITELMAGKDHLERGMAILRAAGYAQHNHVVKHVQYSIDILRMDIIGLQLGTLPMETVKKEKAA